MSLLSRSHVNALRPSASASLRAGVATLLVLGSVGLAQAQTQPPAMPVQPAPVQGQVNVTDEARGPRQERMGERGMMTGGMPLMMFCNEQNELSPRFIKRFEKTLQVKPDQRADFDALKAAVTKTDQIFKSACPSKTELGDFSPTAHLARIEKTAQATVDALKLVRPPFDSLYGKL
ncbi:MAG: hypothetical protein NTZ22_13090, partial [Hyphomicrobiales bacterium]|nr:hypothetical protein [Hyphomicrobiales bacterium]